MNSGVERSEVAEAKRPREAWLAVTKHGFIVIAMLVIAYGLLLKDFALTFKAIFFMGVGLYFIFAVLGKNEIYTGATIIPADGHFVSKLVFFCLGLFLFFTGIYRILF